MSLLLNFGFLYFAIILVAFHVPPLFVTVTIGITILAITIFMGEDDLRTTVTAFYASLIVVCLILVLIFIIEHWAMVQGFGTEDSDELEGMSTLIGISYFKVSVTTTILSSLGAIGQQIIGTTFNTLFFGFFGGFLALFIWFLGLHYSFGAIMNNKIFVAEMIEILIAFIGVLITVPMTAWVMTKRRKSVIDNYPKTK